MLTEGNVMVTMVNGAPWRQMMKLTDWLILADGQQVSEEFIPVPKEDTAPPASPAPIGTKFRWTLTPETYRVAIMTAKGVLQVKSITDGGGEVHETGCACVPCSDYRMVPRPPWQQTLPLKKKMFADEAVWRASLPAGGSVERVKPDTRDVIQKRVEQPLPATLTDVEKVSALRTRFKIKGSCRYAESYNERVTRITGRLLEARAKLNTLSPQEMLKGNVLTEMNYWIRWYRTAVNQQQAVNSAVAGLKPVHFYPCGTGKLYAQIGGKKREIMAFHGRIAVRGDTFKSYENFAEAGVDRAANGKPILSVLYRRRMIDL